MLPRHAWGALSYPQGFYPYGGRGGRPAQPVVLCLVHVVLGLASLFAPVPEAFASGTLKVASRLLDSESRSVWAPRPEVGLGLGVVHDEWSGWLGVSLLPDSDSSHEDQSFDDPDDYAVTLTRAEGWRRFGAFFLAGGRMELRPFDVPLHHGNEAFLRDTARTDGLSFGYREAPLHVQLVVGAPLVTGLVAAYEPEHIKFLASYVFRHNAVTQVPVAWDVSRLGWSSRAFDAHDWELAAVSTGKKVAVTALFQGRHAGEMRFADSAYGRTADTPGAVDRTLPRTSGDYRALTQIAFLLSDSAASEGSLWLAVAAGGASSPRYHVGASDVLARRQSSGSKMFLGLSLEETWAGVRGQGGVSFDYASEQVYQWLNKRDDMGKLEVSRGRARAWLAVSLDF